MDWKVIPGIYKINIIFLLYLIWAYGEPCGRESYARMITRKY